MIIYSAKQSVNQYSSYLVTDLYEQNLWVTKKHATQATKNTKYLFNFFQPNNLSSVHKMNVFDRINTVNK